MSMMKTLLDVQQNEYPEPDDRLDGFALLRAEIQDELDNAESQLNAEPGLMLLWHFHNDHPDFLLRDWHRHPCLPFDPHTHQNDDNAGVARTGPAQGTVADLLAQADKCAAVNNHAGANALRLDAAILKGKLDPPPHPVGDMPDGLFTPSGGIDDPRSVWEHQHSDAELHNAVRPFYPID